MGELLGYARTSTKEQRLDLQLDALRAAGVKERYLYHDQASGARKDRPGFLQCLHDLREGTCDETPFEASCFLFSIRNWHFVTKVTRKIVSFGLKRRKNCRFLPTAEISSWLLASQ